MKKLQMPSSYAVLSAEEQRAACGGGEFSDAVSDFFNNLHLDDFFYGNDLISISISFVPMLLFQAVKLGVTASIAIYNELSNFLNQIIRAGTTALVGSGHQPQEQSALSQTNSFGFSSGLLK